MAEYRFGRIGTPRPQQLGATDERLLVLAAALAFFHLGNGAMLPLFGLAVSAAGEGNVPCSKLVFGPVRASLDPQGAPRGEEIAASINA